MDSPFIVGFKVLLIVAALVLAAYDVFRVRGRTILAWAVLALALALALR